MNRIVELDGRSAGEHHEDLVGLHVAHHPGGHLPDPDVEATEPAQLGDTGLRGAAQ